VTAATGGPISLLRRHQARPRRGVVSLSSDLANLIAHASTFVRGRRMISVQRAFPRSHYGSFEANLRRGLPALGRVSPRPVIGLFDLRPLLAASQAYEPRLSRGRRFHLIGQRPCGFLLLRKEIARLTQQSESGSQRAIILLSYHPNTRRGGAGETLRSILGQRPTTMVVGRVRYAGGLGAHGGSTTRAGPSRHLDTP
jgi:hypothetical protein